MMDKGGHHMMDGVHYMMDRVHHMMDRVHHMMDGVHHMMGRLFYVFMFLVLFNLQRRPISVAYGWKLAAF